MRRQAESGSWARLKSPGRASMPTYPWGVPPTWQPSHMIYRFLQAYPGSQMLAGGRMSPAVQATSCWCRMITSATQAERPYTSCRQQPGRGHSRGLEEQTQRRQPAALCRGG